MFASKCGWPVGLGALETVVMKVEMFELLLGFHRNGFGGKCAVS